MFNCETKSLEEKRNWMEVHGDLQLFESLESDTRPPTEEAVDIPEGYSEFYWKNKLKYIDNTDSDDHEEMNECEKFGE